MALNEESIKLIESIGEFKRNVEKSETLPEIFFQTKNKFFHLNYFTDDDQSLSIFL